MQDLKPINNMDKTRTFQIIISSTVVSNIVDVHWQKRGVTRHIRRNVFEIQQINYYYYYYYYISPSLALKTQYFAHAIIIILTIKTYFSPIDN